MKIPTAGRDRPVATCGDLSGRSPYNFNVPPAQTPRNPLKSPETPFGSVGKPVRKSSPAFRRVGKPVRKSAPAFRRVGKPVRKSALPFRPVGKPVRKSAPTFRCVGKPVRKSAPAFRRVGKPVRKSASPSRRGGRPVIPREVGDPVQGVTAISEASERGTSADASYRPRKSPHPKEPERSGDSRRQMPAPCPLSMVRAPGAAAIPPGSVLPLRGDEASATPR